MDYTLQHIGKDCTMNHTSFRSSSPSCTYHRTRMDHRKIDSCGTGLSCEHMHNHQNNSCHRNRGHHYSNRTHRHHKHIDHFEHNCMNHLWMHEVQSLFANWNWHNWRCWSLQTPSVL